MANNKARLHTLCAPDVPASQKHELETSNEKGIFLSRNKTDLPLGLWGGVRCLCPAGPPPPYSLCSTKLPRLGGVASSTPPCAPAPPSPQQPPPLPKAPPSAAPPPRVPARCRPGQSRSATGWDPAVVDAAQPEAPAQAAQGSVVALSALYSCLA